MGMALAIVLFMAFNLLVLGAAVVMIGVDGICGQMVGLRFQQS